MTPATLEAIEQISVKGIDIPLLATEIRRCWTLLYPHVPYWEYRRRECVHCRQAFTFEMDGQYCETRHKAILVASS